MTELIVYVHVCVCVAVIQDRTYVDGHHRLLHHSHHHHGIFGDPSFTEPDSILQVSFIV